MQIGEPNAPRRPPTSPGRRPRRRTATVAADPQRAHGARRDESVGIAAPLPGAVVAGRVDGVAALHAQRAAGRAGSGHGRPLTQGRPADAQHLVGRQRAHDHRAGPGVGGEHGLRVQRDAHVPEPGLLVAQEHEVAGQHVGERDRRRDGEQVLLRPGQRDARRRRRPTAPGTRSPRSPGPPSPARTACRASSSPRSPRTPSPPGGRAGTRAGAGSWATPRCAPPPAAATGASPPGSPAAGFCSCAAGGGRLRPRSAGRRTAASWPPSAC